MKKIELHYQKGQALITLLFFMSITITVTAAAVIVILSGSLTATKFQEGVRVYYIAESGIENALLRLLRDPSYTGETLAVDDGTAEVTVTYNGDYTITSVGRVGSFEKSIRATASYSSGILTISNWREI